MTTDVKILTTLLDMAIRDGFAFNHHRRGCTGCDECRRLHNVARDSLNIYYHKAGELLTERPNYAKGPAA